MKLEKFFYLLGIFCLYLFVSSTACIEKEVIDREATEYQSQVEQSSSQILTINSNVVTITASYPPAEAPESTTIFVKTKADPEGLVFNVVPEFNETHPNLGTTLQEMRSTVRVEIASHTRADFRQLQVDPAGDELTIDVDNGAYTETYPVRIDFFPMVTFSPAFTESDSNDATLTIYDLSLAPEDKPEAHLYSGIDPVGFPVEATYNDPALELPPPAFPSYTAEFHFNLYGWSFPDESNLALREGDTLFVRYRDRIFYLTAFNPEGDPMEEME